MAMLKTGKAGTGKIVSASKETQSCSGCGKILPVVALINGKCSVCRK